MNVFRPKFFFSNQTSLLLLLLLLLCLIFVNKLVNFVFRGKVVTCLEEGKETRYDFDKRRNGMKNKRVYLVEN